MPFQMWEQTYLRAEFSHFVPILPFKDLLMGLYIVFEHLYIYIMILLFKIFQMMYHTCVSDKVKK